MTNDTISRQAAIDKADSLYRNAKNDECYMITGYNHALSDMRAILKALPSAQPEIIRCKDCRHANECHKNVQYTRHESNSVTIGYSSIEWCSRGERRIDGRFNQQTGGNRIDR